MFSILELDHNVSECVYQIHKKTFQYITVVDVNVPETQKQSRTGCSTSQSHSEAFNTELKLTLLQV